MSTIKKCFDTVEWGLKGISGLLLVAFTVLTLVQVIARYVFQAPLSWSEQAARYLFVWMIMLYMPVIMRDGGNLGFDLVVKHLPKKVRNGLWLLCEVLICGFAGLYCLYSVQLCERFAGKIMIGLNIKAPWVYASQIAGAGILCLFTLEMIVNHLLRLHRGEEGAE